MRNNFNATGYPIADEEVVRNSAVPARIGHDLIRAAGFEVWTGAGKTGTQLVYGTQYELSVKDDKRSLVVAEDVYTLFALLDAAYNGIPLYLSYTTFGDYLSIENISELITELGNIIDPIGTIKPHPVGLPGVVPLGSEFQLCDGSVVLDAASPMNGNRVPNLVGADVVLSVVWTADAGGAHGTIPVADTYALGVHDYVAGTGIAEHSVIKSIDYATGAIVISDPAATGVIECTFWNEGRGIVGGAFGSVGDRGQRLTGSLTNVRGNAATQDEAGVFSSIDSGTANYGALSGAVEFDFLFDSANSPSARTSADTWGKTKTDAYSMGIYIKIKNVS